jgi:hypothetical protein
MEAFDTIIQNLYGFTAALIGAIIGGIFTLRATDKAIREENEKEVRRDEREVQNMLDAIGVEIGTLWNFHMSRIGGMVEQMQEGGALEFYYPLTQDYFTVYNTNAGKIGSVKDAVLREAVVVCYNKCKKVVDGFKYNNQLFSDYRDMLLMPPASAQHGDYVKAKYNELVQYAMVIKEDHFEVKGYVERLLTLIMNRDSVVSAKICKIRAPVVLRDSRSICACFTSSKWYSPPMRILMIFLSISSNSFSALAA